MDRKIAIFEAAREGNIEFLERVLQQNPSILDDIKVTSQTSLLHVAAKSGQLNFVRELLRRDVDIAGDLDEEGFRALDLAVIMGKVAIVKEILSFDRELARLTGKDSRSALHYAAAKGRVEIIGELLSACPDCLEWVTVHGESALHLAVKNYQFEAFAELVKWVERLSKESMMKAQDGDGNNVLHLAVSTKHYACVKLVVDEKSCMMRGEIDGVINAQNGKGLTPLDISDIIIQDCYDAKVRETLQQSGGVRSNKAQESCTITTTNSSSTKTSESQAIQINDEHVDDEPKSWLEYFKFQKNKESPSEMRNTMLVVVALIVTITYQAGINPPSKLFEPEVKINSTHTINRGDDASLYSIDFMFLFGNALGFSSAGIMLEYLTLGFPLHRELSISIFTMSFTYVTAISLANLGRYRLRTMAIRTVFIALVIPLAVRWLPSWLKQAYHGTRRPATSAPVA